MEYKLFNGPEFIGHYETKSRAIKKAQAVVTFDDDEEGYITGFELIDDKSGRPNLLYIHTSEGTGYNFSIEEVE